MVYVIPIDLYASFSSVYYYKAVFCVFFQRNYGFPGQYLLISTTILNDTYTTTSYI